MVGMHEAQELGLPRKGQEVHGQQERDDLAVAKAGLGPGTVSISLIRVSDPCQRVGFSECRGIRHRPG